MHCVETDIRAIRACTRLIRTRFCGWLSATRWQSTVSICFLLLRCSAVFIWSEESRGKLIDDKKGRFSVFRGFSHFALYRTSTLSIEYRDIWELILLSENWFLRSFPKFIFKWNPESMFDGDNSYINPEIEVHYRKNASSSQDYRFHWRRAISRNILKNLQHTISMMVSYYKYSPLPPSREFSLLSRARPWTIPAHPERPECASSRGSREHCTSRRVSPPWCSPKLDPHNFVPRERRNCRRSLPVPELGCSSRPCDSRRCLIPPRSRRRGSRPAETPVRGSRAWYGVELKRCTEYWGILFRYSRWDRIHSWISVYSCTCTFTATSSGIWPDDLVSEDMYYFFHSTILRHNLRSQSRGDVGICFAEQIKMA